MTQSGLIEAIRFNGGMSLFRRSGRCALNTVDSLLTIAEVAVAFAGFSTLASLIGNRASRDDRRVDAMRLANVVTSSLLVVALAFLPVLLLDFIGPDNIVWMVSSLIAAVCAILAALLGRRRKIQAQSLPGFSARTYYFGIFLGLISIAGFAINATGAPGVYSHKIYQGALLLALAVSGIQFSQVVTSLLESKPSK